MQLQQGQLGRCVIIFSREQLQCGAVAHLAAQAIRPYPISYFSLVPQKTECRNLLVPVCLSATHVAYTSIRMEPVYMVLGQAAGAAAALALGDGRAVQEVPYQQLREVLLRAGQILDVTP